MCIRDRYNVAFWQKINRNNFAIFEYNNSINKNSGGFYENKIF